MISGTLEEVCAENVIQLGLNMIPLSAFMPLSVAMQAEEVLQETLTPKSNASRLNHQDFVRLVRRDGYAVAAINYVSRRDSAGAGTKAVERANKLAKDLTGVNGRI